MATKQLNIFQRVAKSFLMAFSHLPLRVLYVISTMTYWLAYYVVRYRRDVVKSNLAMAFPEKSEAERKAIMKRFYRHICDYFFETIKALTIPMDELLKRFNIVNPEIVDKYSLEGRQVFLYSGHIGNWEWFISLPKYFKHARVHTFYKTQHNALSNDITLSTRTRNGIVAASSHNGYRHVIECKRNNELTATLIIGDQCPKSSAQKHWTMFLGIDTPFFCGPATIAKKADQVMVYPSFRAYKRGYYEVEFKVVEDNPTGAELSTMIDKYASYLEEDIRRIPELWLWSHRRWKLKHEDFPNE